MSETLSRQRYRDKKYLWRTELSVKSYGGSSKASESCPVTESILDCEHASLYLVAIPEARDRGVPLVVSSSHTVVVHSLFEQWRLRSPEIPAAKHQYNKL